MTHTSVVSILLDARRVTGERPCLSVMLWLVPIVVVILGLILYVVFEAIRAMREDET